jgi:hypothetical protein
MASIPAIERPPGSARRRVRVSGTCWLRGLNTGLDVAGGDETYIDPAFPRD